jgi:pyrimidine-nucleoside phosphorylase
MQWQLPELQEAIDTSKVEDRMISEHCMVVSGIMLHLGGLASDEKMGRKMAEAALDAGSALAKFREFIQAQGGDVSYVDNTDKLDKASLIVDIESPRSGYLAEINACEAGKTAVLLGGGRTRKGDTIDYTVGLLVNHKVGDKVNEGDLLFTIHANQEDKLELARQKMLAAHKWSDNQVQPLPLYYGMVD